MNDPRLRELANILIEHSCDLQPGEHVLIEAIDLPDPALVCQLIECASQRDAHAFVSWKSNAILRSLYRAGSDQSMSLAGRFERERMQQMQAYIGVRGAANSSQFADVAGADMQRYQKRWWQPVHSEVRVPSTKWVVLRYPTDSFAQAADMSTPAFEDFYFDVCTTDYKAMAEAQKPLVERMQAAQDVRVVGPGTELAFSIKDIPVIPCAGERNIPDGEVFTAPVRDSVQGTISYNAKSRYQGTVYDQIQFTFQDGRIIDARSNETEKINQLLDADEGARFIGEWSIGCNNRVRHPMLDTLFDEKIGGSMHLTPGQAYEEADNGNRSSVHWDLVLIQREDYGGGEIFFDGELIRRDGFFVPEELQPLNEGL